MLFISAISPRKASVRDEKRMITAALSERLGRRTFVREAQPVPPPQGSLGPARRPHVLQESGQRRIAQDCAEAVESSADADR